jgi:glyoxylase-like metal-dependent hydrolase (beta-lactamase superfamily II)
MHFHDHSQHQPQNHVQTYAGRSTRRDFLRVLMGSTLAGASFVELAYHRAAWARPAADPGTKLFDIEQAADGIYFAQARAQALINCNAAIFVRAKDVVVVDAHSKPSAATSLLGQIKREVSGKPVRYVINTHFHWDHTQGNHAYRAAEPKIDFIASATTKQSMSEMALARLKASIEEVPKEVEALRTRAAKSSSAAEKAFCAEQIRQFEAYAAELENYTLELPTITFDKSYALPDAAFELHAEFHGYAHTGGDVVVFCPARQVVATGDMIHGIIPNIADGYPHSWPGTIKSVGQLGFAKILPGHSVQQNGRTMMQCMGNYIEELTGKVQDGKKAGLSVAEMQKRFTVASLKSLQSNGYAEYIVRNTNQLTPHFGELPPLQDSVNENISDIYKNLDRV